MNKYEAIQTFYCIGVEIHKGDIITVLSATRWKCSTNISSIFCGNVLANSLGKVVPIEESAEREIDKVCMKVKVMYERQPYYKKITGQPEENITPTPGNLTDYIIESRSWWEETDLSIS